MDDWITFELDENVESYLDWIRDPGPRYMPDFEETGPFIPAVVCINKPLAVSNFLKEGTSGEMMGFREGRDYALSVPFDIYSDLGTESSSQLNCLSFSATPSFFEALGTDENLASLRDEIDKILIAQRLPPDAYCPLPPSAESADPNGDELTNETIELNRGDDHGFALVGIIDEGIAFAHERFRLPDHKTRVEYFWHQDGKCRGPHPNGFYGREQRKDDWRYPQHGSSLHVDGIDTMLTRSVVGNQVDEDRFYRTSGLLDYTKPGHKAAAHRVAHGTHVLDIAAGYAPNNAPGSSVGLNKRPIIAVQLPTRTVADTSGLGLEKYMLDGVRYILNRARRFSIAHGIPNLPVVINFSSQLLAGPHDGRSVIEEAIEELLQERRNRIDGTGGPTELVLPAGNSHLSRGHARVSLKPNGEEGSSHILKWKVLPDDRTFSFLEIWLPRSESAPSEAEVTFELIPPGREQGGTLSDSDPASGKKWVYGDANEDTVAKIYSEFVLERSKVTSVDAPEEEPTQQPVKSGRGRFCAFLLPTSYQERGLPVAPAGVWSIKLENQSSESKELHAWIQWDDRPLSYPIYGRQSYFLDAEYEKYDRISGRLTELDNAESTTKRAGTINAIGTGETTVVVGGYLNKELKPARYSAAGEIRALEQDGAKTDIPGPSASAVSDDSEVLDGILAAGSRSGSTVAMNGTSVAAPQVTRWLADELATQPNPEKLGRKRIGERARVDEADVAHHAKHSHSTPNAEQTATANRIGAGRIRRIHPATDRVSQVFRLPEEADSI